MQDKPRKHLVHPHEPLDIFNNRCAPMRREAGSSASRVEEVAYLWRCLVFNEASEGGSWRAEAGRGQLVARSRQGLIPVDPTSRARVCPVRKKGRPLPAATPAPLSLPL